METGHQIHRLPAPEARRRAEAAVEALKRDPRVRLVYLFGSGADPEATTVRDIDLAVAADASIVLGWEIANTGCCLYADSPEADLDFVVRARSRYWDFEPFLKTQWRLAGERLEERLRGRPA